MCRFCQSKDGVPHTRVRPYHSNVARYGHGAQPLDCDFCMAVRAGRHVVLRGQTGVGLDEVMRGRGDAAAQDKASDETMSRHCSRKPALGCRMS